MQVEVIYDHGVLAFKHPLRFRQAHFTMQVEIPEQVVIEAEEATFPAFDLSLFSTGVRAQIARLEAIQQAVINQSLPNDDEEESEEQHQRWDAFELRNALHREQGRAI